MKAALRTCNVEALKTYLRSDAILSYLLGKPKRRKLLFTFYDEDIAYALLENHRVRELCLEYESKKYGTPLLNAIEQNEYRYAHILVECGANVNYMTVNGYDTIITPLSSVLYSYNTSFNIPRLTRLRLLIESLLKAGANANDCLSNKESNQFPSPLFIGVIHGDAYVVELLLKYGAITDIRRVKHGQVYHFVHVFESIYEIAHTTHQGYEKLKLLFAYTHNFAFDYYTFFRSVLRKADYQIIELALAYLHEKIQRSDLSKYFTVIDDFIFCNKEKNALSKLIFNTCLNFRNCELCVKNKPITERVTDYLRDTNLDLFDFLTEALPALFELLTLHLRFEDIRSEITELKK